MLFHRFTNFTLGNDARNPFKIYRRFLLFEHGSCASRSIQLLCLPETKKTRSIIIIKGEQSHPLVLLPMNAFMNQWMSARIARIILLKSGFQKNSKRRNCNSHLLTWDINRCIKNKWVLENIQDCYQNETYYQYIVQPFKSTLKQRNTFRCVLCIW